MICILFVCVAPPNNAIDTDRKTAALFCSLGRFAPSAAGYLQR